MRRPGGAAGATAARLLGLLAVVLGLLVMHGLASGHHMSGAAAGHDVAAVLAVDEVPGTHGTAGASRHGVGSAVTVTPPGTGFDAGAGRSTCDDGCPTAVAVVCVAVLTAAAVAVALGRMAAARCSPLFAPRVRGDGARAPAPPRRFLPARDPVAGLCVSRT